MSEDKQKRREAKKKRQWEEVEEYRALLEAPDKFDEGFTLRTVIGVLFISLIIKKVRLNSFLQPLQITMS